MNERQAVRAGSQRYSLVVLYCACTILLIAVFLLDLATPPGIAVGVLYVLVVLVSLWLPHNQAILGFSVVSSALIVAALFYEPQPADMLKVIYNRGISLFTVWVIALLGLKRRQMEQLRNSILRDREKALQEVKILRGLLPICASCKKIRDDQGYWTQIEGYIKRHSEADFTHSICPECAERLYPDFFKKSDFYRKK